jgi:beta-mannosidase
MHKTIDLSGTWRIKSATSDRGGLREWPTPQPLMPTYPAEVPGTVQEAFEFMTGDVHLGHNVYNARFIEEQYWLYTRHVTLTEEDLSLGRVRLVFEGLDLCALVYVNGKQVAMHNNFYVPLRVDVTDAVVVGDNRIDVRLDSGLYDTAFKDVNMVQGHPTSKLLRRVWSRKPQSAYEWDWSPRLLNVGIYKPCRIEIAPAHLNETAVYHTLNEDYSEAAITVRQYVMTDTERTVRFDTTMDASDMPASVLAFAKK